MHPGWNIEVSFNLTETQTCLPLLVPDSPVKLFPLQTDEIISRVYDAALGSDGPRCINVVTSYHPHCDARALTLPDGFRHLEKVKGIYLHRNKMPIMLQIDGVKDFMY